MNLADQALFLRCAPPWPSSKKIRSRSRPRVKVALRFALTFPWAPQAWREFQRRRIAVAGGTGPHSAGEMVQSIGNRVMQRRTFMAIISGSLLASPLAAEAQPAGKVPRVGYVTSAARSINVDVFDQGLRELGYTIGQDIIVEYRFGEGRIDRVPALVDELLRLKVDVLFAANPQAIRAARQATSTVSIVGVDLETNPVEAGWAQNLARPGGNVTGFFLDIPELSGKLIQFLTEAVPGLQRVAVLWDASLATSQFKATEGAARAVRLELQSLAFRRPEDFAASFEGARNQRAQALVLLSAPSVFLNLNRLADLALQYRLPAICVFPQFADAGGLMGYGPNLTDLFRQAANYVDRILKGARAADLPIQRPAVFRLAVNLKTAKALGLTIASSFLARADKIIQ
jgi:putative ABC transport system substrate-binding protein